MGYSIVVPIGVTLHCSIWTRFWNILMSYFIYSVVKAMEPEWSFVKKTDRGRASFLRYWHLKFTAEKPNSYITISVSKLRCHVVALTEVERFRIVMHCYEAWFSRKVILCETKNIFTAENIKFNTKITTNSESSSKMNMKSRWTVFEILPTSAVICIQTVSHNNKTTKYLRNYRCHKLHQDHSKKLL